MANYLYTVWLKSSQISHTAYRMDRLNGFCKAGWASPLR